MIETVQTAALGLIHGVHGALAHTPDWAVIMIAFGAVAALLVAVEP